MGHSTPAGAKVYAVVERWMDTHPEVPGIWDVFEGSRSFDIIVSIHQPDGVRRLTLNDQQGTTTLTPEVELRILDWLDNLSNQPAITPNHYRQPK